MGQAGQQSITPDRLVLAAILHTMKPKQRARVIALIGEVEADNVVQIRRPTSTAERNELVRAAQHIVGVR